MKSSFLLYTEYLENIELLTLEQRGILLTALMYYHSGIELPEMDGVTRMAFGFIKSQMDRDQEKYEDVCQKRSEAGKKSGEVRRKGTKGTNVNYVQQNDQKGTNVDFVQVCSTKRTDNDNDNDNDLNKKENNKRKKSKKGFCSFPESEYDFTELEKIGTGGG